MSEGAAGPIIPDRLQVFISSTITECAVEREAAQRAIVGLNFVPVQFEREGARAEPPRDFYLRKLQGSHIVVAIYRSAYGWIDEAKGMSISGLEDEYRQARRLGNDLLVYVLKDAPDRDPCLETMLNAVMAGPTTLSFYADGEDLEVRIRDDITALVSNQVARFQSLDAAGGSVASLIADIYRGSPFRVRRQALLDALAAATAVGRVTWVTGERGAGKTALAAEWAQERGAPYVNARGLDPRSVLAEAARVLGLADGADLAVPVFEDARSLLLERWSSGVQWPLILDDPDDMGAIWPALAACLAASGTGSVVIVARDVRSDLPGERIVVADFSPDERAVLQSIAGAEPLVGPNELPIAIRLAADDQSPGQRFDNLDAAARELLGYMALSPAPLSLSDLTVLAGGVGGGPVAITDKLGPLRDALIESPTGYAFVHDIYRDRLVEAIGKHPQLRALLLDRLSKRLAQTGRAWAAFAIRRDDNPDQAERLANQSVHEAVFTGSARHMVEALEYLANYYRERGEKGPLISVLVALADAMAPQGRPAEAPKLLEEAGSIATSIGDVEAERTINILRACLTLRRSPSPATIQCVQDLATTAESDHRPHDRARLLLEQGVALLNANETGAAIAVFRTVRDLFIALQDAYGLDLSTRNLVAALATIPGGEAESERLRTSLAQVDPQTPRYRAWLCNLLAPKLRREGRLAEAEAMACEAIAIGEALGDQYLIAINLTILGNVLRAAGRVPEAIEAYAASGRKAQLVGRPDLEGRTSRLLALTENEAGEAAVGAARREHALRAEQYATHAAGLFSSGFAWSEYGYSLEERGDARGLLGRRAEAVDDYADAVAAYLKADDVDDAERLLSNLMGLLGDAAEAPAAIARAFGVTLDLAELGRSAIWVAALKAALMTCPRNAAPQVLGVLVRAFDSGEGTWWFANLIRCLLTLTRDRDIDRPPRLGSLLLLAILGFGRHRQFAVQDLLTLAGICIGQSQRLILRHRPDADLVQILHLARDERILVTLRDEAKHPESVFVALCIGAFLDAFGDEIAEILFGDGLTQGAAVDVQVYPQDTASDLVSKFFAAGLADRPVGTARVLPVEDEETPIIVFVRPDAPTILRADPDRGTDFEVMLADFLSEFTYATIGKTVDDETFAARLRDVLMRVIR